jgi:CheY-like chemotaxis protein
MNADLPILVIGDLSAPEFADAAESLARCGAEAVPNVAAAQIAINEGFAPAVIVVAQRWPSEIAASDVDSLRRVAPLARFVSLLGPWLEGESRTGRPLAASLRVYWHRWNEFSPALDALSPNSPFAWSLPSTSNDDERLLSTHDIEPAVSSVSTGPSLLIAIVASDRSLFQSLADACARRGWQTVWLRNVEAETSFHPDAILLDAATTSDIELSRLVRLRATISRSPIVAILGFPRFEDVSRWKAAGATLVISKPFQSQALLQQVERLVAKPA